MNYTHSIDTTSIVDFDVKNHTCKMESTSNLRTMSDSLRRILGITENEGDHAGVEVTPATALTQPAVWQCVNKIAGIVASVPLQVHRNKEGGGSDVDKKHDQYRILRRKPNKLQTSYDWKRQVMFHALLYGNHVSFIKRNSQGRPIELVPLSPKSTGLFVGEDKRLMYVTAVKGWEHTGPKGSGLAKVFPDNVVHIKGLSDDGLWGLPAIEKLAGSVGVAVAARRFGARFFGKGARPGGVLKLPPGMKEEEAEKFITQFKEQYESLTNSQKVMVLSDPEIDLQLYHYNNEQSQFNDTRIFEDRQVATFFGLPASTVNVPDSVSFNSLEMAKQAELDAVEPHFCNIEHECDEKLFTTQQKTEETHNVHFRREAMKRVDHRTHIETAVMELNNGGLTENEYRALRNRPPVEDGDRLRKPKNIGYTDEPDQPNDGANQVPTEDDQDDINTAAQNVFADMARREVFRVISKAEKAVKTSEGFVSFVDHDIKTLRLDFIENMTDICQIVRCCPATLADTFFDETANELSAIVNKSGLTQEEATRQAANVLDSYRGNNYIRRLTRQ